MTDKEKRVLQPGEFDAMCAERSESSKGGKVTLTPTDASLIRSYLDAYAKLGERMPERLPDSAWDEAMKSLRETGDLPEEYRDKFTVNTQTDPATGETITGIYETAWEEWGKERADLEAKYHDVTIKALRYALQNEGEAIEESPFFNDLLEKLVVRIESATPSEGITAGDLFSMDYITAISGALTRDLMQLSQKGLVEDSITKKATFTTDDGHVITVENFDKLLGGLGVRALKLFDMAGAFLADDSFYGANGSDTRATVEIPLIEYGERCGEQLTPRVMPTDEEQKEENKKVAARLKWFKRNVRQDLHDLSSILWTGEEKKGKNYGNYIEMRIISSHSISRGVIRINFDVDAARYVARSYRFRYPGNLLQTGNRSGNAYRIGRKLAEQSSNYQNKLAGTDGTLSVEALLRAAPDIKTYEEIKAQGQRNWKDKIKRPLEAALDELVGIEVISRWEYRDRKGKSTYTAEAAQQLTWTQYSRLMVDYSMVDPPDETKRLAEIAEARRKRAADKEKTKRKRGRPRKNRDSE